MNLIFLLQWEQGGEAGTVSAQRGTCVFFSCFFLGLIFKNHVYSAEQTDLVLPCSKTYRLDEKFVDTAKNQPLKVRKPRCAAVPVDRVWMSNFRRLVLGCINADFCVQILILQRFSKSTRLPHLCTARSSKSSQIFVKLFHIFAEISAKIAIFQQFSSNFAPISMKIFQNFDQSNAA